jgi:hypothetical protein
MIPKKLKSPSKERKTMPAVEPMDHDVKVVRLENKNFSNRLLARLLKFHGDTPPDKECAEASENLRRGIFASVYNRRDDQAAWEKYLAEAQADAVVEAEATTMFPEKVMRRILGEVAEKHNLPAADIFKDRRVRHIVRARQEAMWRCSEETGYSYPRIGRFFGRDHTTVMHACRVHAARMAEGVATSPLAKPDAV